MKRVLNLAAYKFVGLDDLAALRNLIHEQARERGLKGTVLLAAEGINLALASDAAPLLGFAAWLRTDARLADLAFRQGWSDALPFARLRVKVKREIIRMDCPAVQPAGQRAPALSAATLARWLAAGSDDAGRPLVLLDTRNAFEADHGRFACATDWRLSRFGDFPAALERHRAGFAGKTVVTYCTGGIRCEKAALLMQQAGVEHVWQLDGGILAYFEQTRGAPGWLGSCFVFDDRVTLDPGIAALAA